MSWQAALILTALAFLGLSVAVHSFVRWHSRRFLRVPYSVINAHKITPRFNVGVDVK